MANKLDVSTIRSNIRALTSHHPGRINYAMDETWRGSGYVSWLGGWEVECTWQKLFNVSPNPCSPFFIVMGILAMYMTSYIS